MKHFVIVFVSDSFRWYLVESEIKGCRVFDKTNTIEAATQYPFESDDDIQDKIYEAASSIGVDATNFDYEIIDADEQKPEWVIIDEELTDKGLYVKYQKEGMWFLASGSNQWQKLTYPHEIFNDSTHPMHQTEES